MKEKHIARTSGLLSIVHIITFIFLTLGLISQLATSGLSPIISIIPIVLNILCFVLCIVVKIIKHGNIDYIRFVAIAFSIVYFFLIVLSPSRAAFPYMLPFLMIFVLTLDKLAVNIAIIGYGMTNVVAIIKAIATTTNMSEDIETIMIEAIITIIMIVAVAKGRKLLEQFTTESVGEVTTALEKNESVADKVKDAVSTVKESANEMETSMEEIIRSTELMNRTLSNIMDGTSSTAESITVQTYKTQDIQEIIAETYSKTEAVVEAANDTTAALRHGMSIMSELSTQVEQSKNSNREMQTAANALKANTDEVRGITDIIFSISSQTNLLALNASIEAARAGEAGRGFAVVADEIRALAEQTRQETENIARIINALSENADMVDSCVTNSAESAELEAQNAIDAAEKFQFIATNLEQVSSDIIAINQMAKSIHDSNNEIVDSVSNLSATSEEISACTTDAGSTSEHNLALVNQFADSLRSIVYKINELDSFV